MFIIPIKDIDRNDEIETKHVWIINVPLLMTEIKFVLPVVKKIKQVNVNMHQHYEQFNSCRTSAKLWRECAYTNT